MSGILKTWTLMTSSTSFLPVRVVTGGKNRLLFPKLFDGDSVSVRPRGYGRRRVIQSQYLDADSRSVASLKKHRRCYSNAVGPESARRSGRTPLEVTSILRANEVSVEIHEGPIQGFELNQLASNKPIEDRQSEAKVLTHDAFLFGVFDGHAGDACAQAVSERLFDYLTVFLSPAETVEPYAKAFKEGKPYDSVQPQLVARYLKNTDFHEESLDMLYKHSLSKVIAEIGGTGCSEISTNVNMISAFMRLDQDLMAEALPSATNTLLNDQIMEVAFSGACACVAYVNGGDLHVASIGDCRAVLGARSDMDEWKAIELTREHNAYNDDEVARLIASHPNESTSLIKAGRLLGQLVPLRAFGDVCYKWPVRDLKHVLKTARPEQNFYQQYGDQLIPPNYRTPPYLTAEPEVTHHRLTPRDKFLVLATDGLWELLPPEKVVKLIAGHLDGEQVLEEFYPPDDLPLGEINNLLLKRKQSLANRTVDSNVATHLLRNALGPDHSRLSGLLSLPTGVVRNYRDDISVTVVFFDTEYTEVHPYHKV